MKRDLKLFTAFVPLSRALADTQYNGTATVASAVGIAMGSAKTANVLISLGAVGATSVTYSLMVSKLSSPATADDLQAVAEATIAIASTDANTQKVVSVRLDRAALNEALKYDNLYLYVKRVQVGAVATLDNVSIALTDHQEIPVLVNAGYAANVEALG